MNDIEQRERERSRRERKRGEGCRERKRGEGCRTERKDRVSERERERDSGKDKERRSRKTALTEQKQIERKIDKISYVTIVLSESVNERVRKER